MSNEWNDCVILHLSSLLYQGAVDRQSTLADAVLSVTHTVDLTVMYKNIIVYS